MRLLKVSDGKLEIDNFYLYSDFSDYAGSSNVSRDTVNRTVSLNSDDKIERKFDYEQFVVEVKKQNWSKYKVGDYNCCYIGTSNNRYGIKDDIQGEHPYWKLLRQDGYIQVYSSEDGIEWTNVGGILISDAIISQGFWKKGDLPFILESYRVYKQAFITLLNFPESTMAILQDELGNELKRRLFDSDLSCEIYLDYCINGKLVFMDPQENVLYTTEIMDLQYGDIYILSPYELEIIYQGQPVINPTMLDSLCDSVTIKNVSTTESYFNLTLGTKEGSGDLVQLSWDNNTFTDTVPLAEIKPNQEITLFVKVFKSIDNHNFQVGDFQLTIE